MVSGVERCTRKAAMGALNSAATFCIHSLGLAVRSRQTMAGFPLNGCAVNASS